MEYREATPEDVEALTELCWSLQNYESGIDDLLDVSDKARESIQERMEEKINDDKYKFFVAEDKGKVVGYTFGVIEEKSRRYRVRETGYICEMYVKEDCRGKGVARELVNLLTKWFRGNGVAYVEVDVYSKNKLGCSFWGKSGFKDYMRKLIKKYEVMYDG